MTMWIKKCVLVVLMCLSINMTWGVTRYASPTGVNLSGRTIDTPGELHFMVSKLQPGDTLFLLDGQYDLVNTLVVNVKAKPDEWVFIYPVSGAHPILDFRKQQNGTNGVKVTGAHILIKDITIRYAGKKGIWLENASYCRLENLDVYGCCDSGIQLRKGGYNLVVNCDSHDNFDYQAGGGNADGFADKQGGDAFAGNTYIGCRAWNNSDDGWDSFQRETKDSVPTTYLFCVTYNNGPAEFDLTNHPRATGVDRELPCLVGKDLKHIPNSGNPNGFKLGGQGKDNKESGIYTRHHTVLMNCLAVGHRKKGFDQNNNAGEMEISHCMAVDNDINYGFGNAYPCTLNIHHCISLSPISGKHLLTARETTVSQADNSWNEPNHRNISIIDGIDIVHVLLAARQADGQLPVTLLEILRKL